MVGEWQDADKSPASLIRVPRFSITVELMLNALAKVAAPRKVAGSKTEMRLLCG